MSKKPVKPAHPIATDPEVQFLEKLARDQIASIKHHDLERGAKVSRDTSEIVQHLQLDKWRGQKVLKGAREAHEKLYGSAEEKLQRWSKIREAYKTLTQQDPDLSESEKDQQIATELKVAVRTVQRRKK